MLGTVRLGGLTLQLAGKWSRASLDRLQPPIRTPSGRDLRIQSPSGTDRRIQSPSGSERARPNRERKRVGASPPLKPQSRGERRARRGLESCCVGGESEFVASAPCGRRSRNVLANGNVAAGLRAGRLPRRARRRVQCRRPTPDGQKRSEPRSVRKRSVAPDTPATPKPMATRPLRTHSALLPPNGRGRTRPAIACTLASLTR